MQSALSRRRVVVTGIGAITPIGLSAAAFWDSLTAGRSGIGAITFFDSSIYPCRIAAEVHDFEPGKYMDRKDARRMARFSQFAVAATREAIADAGLKLENEDRDRIGVVLGNGNAGMPTSEESSRMLQRGQGLRLSPFVAPMMLANMAASHVTMEFGITGYSSTIITACAAGTQAIGEATEMIRRGALDVVITGGAEATICELGLAGFCSLRALSTKSNDQPEKASRPFDGARDGFVAGEGAGILILEDLERAQARGATI
ncbi:MAG: beta-ketoacyl synthase N-terminal-like domain-containing protein, partial [Chloroflexi bacterium]|nr:beta-ketoacyl synthase N-terminal-like domain-containing protein [Chloroflexota bacterium]